MLKRRVDRGGWEHLQGRAQAFKGSLRRTKRKGIPLTFAKLRLQRKFPDAAHCSLRAVW